MASLILGIQFKIQWFIRSYVIQLLTILISSPTQLAVSATQAFMFPHKAKLIPTFQFFTTFFLLGLLFTQNLQMISTFTSFSSMLRCSSSLSTITVPFPLFFIHSFKTLSTYSLLITRKLEGRTKSLPFSSLHSSGDNEPINKWIYCKVKQGKENSKYQ